ncbi:MAG: hypothetical protein Q9175_007611 [Cornicularia normoerica]
MSPATIQQTLDDHYPVEAAHSDRINAFTWYTAKASLLARAADRNAITYVEYLEYTFSILVEFTASQGRKCDIFPAVPVVMCIDEGSSDGFKKELARLFGEKSKKAAKLTVKFSNPDDWWGGKESYDYGGELPFEEDTAAMLRLLKAKGIGKISADWSLVK